MDRRSDTITHVAIELCEDRYEAQWPALAFITGCWQPGLWKHRAIWCIEVMIHFRMPAWSMQRTDQGAQLFVDGAWRDAGYVEPREHWVYAKSREAAISCLVRDLRADPRHEFISHAAIYRITPPLTMDQVRRIEAINSRLVRERMDQQEAEARDARTSRAGRQLAFVGMQ